MLTLMVSAGSYNSATSPNGNHKVWTSGPNHPEEGLVFPNHEAYEPHSSRLGAVPESDVLTPWFPVRSTEKLAHLLLLCLWKFHPNQELVSAGMCAAGSFLLIT